MTRKQLVNSRQNFRFRFRLEMIGRKKMPFIFQLIEFQRYERWLFSKTKSQKVKSRLLRVVFLMRKNKLLCLKKKKNTSATLKFPNTNLQVTM